MTKRGDKAMELDMSEIDKRPISEHAQKSKRIFDKFLKGLEIVNINDPAEDFNNK